MNRKIYVRDYIFLKIIVILLAFEMVLFGVTYKLIIKDYFANSINNYLDSSFEYCESNGKNIVQQINVESIKIVNGNEIYNILNDDIDVEEKRKLISSHIKPFCNALTMFSGLEIIDFNGNTYSLIDKNINVENIDIGFISQKEKYNLYLSEQLVKDDGGNTYLVFGKLMKNYFTGSEAGFLIMYVDETVFNSIYESSRFKGDTFFVVRNNRIISSNDKNVIGNYFSDSQYSLFKNNKRFLCENFTFTIAPGIVFDTYTLISKNKMFEESKNIFESIIFATILIFILSLIVARIVSNDLTRKIAVLILKIKDFSMWKKVRFDEVSNDEIGELEKSFQKMTEDIEDLMQRNIQEKQRQKEAELKALQAQINPHFVYNAINAIRSMALVHDNWDVEKACTSLSNFFRIGLNSGKDTVDIFSEMKHVQSYVDIEKIRFPDRFDVLYNIDNSVMKLKILKTIIQPLVENSIKHGFGEKGQRLRIKIEGYLQGDYIIIKVIDNGKGFDEDPLLKKNISNKSQSGYGVYNVNERIVLFYGQDCGLSYSKTANGGTTVTVKVRNIGDENDERKEME